jgi:3,4-dihydroxy 2-butanone 4-phosphate synthase/GTP cyclohydrolase II
MLEEISRRVQTVIHTIQSGGIAIVTDDEDRENEGDLICAAEKITPEIVNFMVKEARGMLCVPLSQERANQLNLKSMVSVNRESQQTHFTVTVDAALNISTGISANDRAHTIKLLSSPISSPADFVQPGHINPLIAQKGGVLRRAGHTEAAVDLCRLANLNEVGVIIEIMNENGSMARNQELIDFLNKTSITHLLHQ